MTQSTFCAWVGWGVVALALPCTGETTSLELIQTIPMPGVEGRIDHLALDGKEHRLYVAALGNNTVEVVDLAAARVTHQFTGLKEPQGIMVVPEPHEVVVTSGGDGSVRFYDPYSWQLNHTLELTSDADNVRYDPTEHLLYVGYGEGGIAIIDARTHTSLAFIALTGHPESFALEQPGPRMFVNVPAAKRIEVLDRSTRSVLRTWNIATDFAPFFAAPNSRAYANFPMALDDENHRLFVGYRQPARLQMFDTEAQKPVAQIEISRDADDIFYDSVGERLYIACGEGFIDVIDRIDGDHYERVARVVTAPGSRTATWDPLDRRFYLAVPHRGAQPSEIRIYAPPR